MMGSDGGKLRRDREMNREDEEKNKFGGWIRINNVLLTIPLFNSYLHGNTFLGLNLDMNLKKRL